MVKPFEKKTRRTQHKKQNKLTSRHIQYNEVHISFDRRNRERESLEFIFPVEV
jgi:hypothetical protein